MRSLRWGSALGALAVGLISNVAFAQSTGSQAVEEEIVVTGTGTRSIGVAIRELEPKSRSSIDQAYIDTQQAGQTVLESLNLTPGYNFVNNDPYGNSGGNVRIRGFDGQRISLLQDGIPLNDTGNYAIYSNQQLDSELVQRVAVNIGTTDVDSPTASAVGGTINYITKVPDDEMGLLAQGSYGTFDYKRGIVVLDTGTLGPWGTKAWVAGSYTDYDKFKGPGSLTKKQVNFRVYQPLGDNGDFISLLGHYNENRNNFYRNLRLSEFQADPDIDRVTTCPRATAAAGTVQNENVAPFNACGSTTIGVDSGYYNLFINPSNTGNIRGQGKFTLTEGVTLTVDPSFQYTLANGGGNEVVSETDPRLQGSQYVGTTAATRIARGVDLNGDGDILDSIRLYRPNNTNTKRYGLTTSLIWEISDGQTIRGAYTYDRGRHRQTGEFGFLDAQGNPENVFGGRNGREVTTLDGNPLQNRDRLSIALLNQFAAEYRGQFMDDRLSVNLGVRAPFFKRELNQNCFTITASNTTPGVTQASGGGFAYCSAQSEASYLAAIGNTANTGTTNGIVDFGTPVTSRTTALRRPFQATVKYDKLLPNLGISFRPGEGHQIYASYAEGLSAPRTDDLYDVQLPDIQPETTKAFDLGYRYQRGPVLATAATYYYKFDNRLVRAFDQDQGLNITRNVGRVDFKGFDGQIGFSPLNAFTLYGTYTYTDTEVKSDLVIGRVAGVATVLPTKGKQLVETPKHQWGARASYDGEIFQAGIEIKHVGDRFSTDVNDEVAPSYNVVDLDARVRLDQWGWEGSYIKLNVSNLFDKNYLGNISSVNNAVAIPASVSGNAIAGSFATYSVGAPRSVSVTLRVRL